MPKFVSNRAMRFAIASLLAIIAAPVVAATQTAQYRVTFQATWSPTTHPTDFPEGRAHWSSLIGAVHGGDVTFWGPGQIATDGIEAMAERGATSLLTAEIQAAIIAGTARAVVTGGGIADGSGSASASFTASLEHPLLSLTSMVAPSPDWFVGVHDFSLLENGEWVQQRIVQLFAYDAGTDSGSTFLSSDSDTRPRAPISRILGPPLSAGVPLGSLTLTRIDTPPGPALTLREGRFEVTASYRDFDLDRGQGRPVELTDETGFFWFFSPENLEVVVKVIDGCGFNGNYWVFVSGLTNVEVELQVTDTSTGQTNDYSNTLGEPFRPIQDTAAFATCP